jgi:hypothetical protein
MNRVNIINKIQETYSFKKYLEIGVRHTKDCFDHIQCSTKHSVDPGFETKNNPATYKTTSDNFFTKLESNQLDLPSDYKWDIIFIDGLHLSYQVEKDILNSLNHLSENGIIALHDCNPFLYEDNYTRLVEDYWNQAWNGTVWKTIYKLRTSRPDLNVCTVNIDEGVSLIKRGSQNLIPFDNPYFEYRIFQKEVDTALNTIEFSQLNNWLKN